MDIENLRQRLDFGQRRTFLASFQGTYVGPTGEQGEVFLTQASDLSHRPEGGPEVVLFGDELSHPRINLG